MSDYYHTITLKLWLALAALSGGLTSVALLKPLTWAGRLVAVAVGFGAAMFVAPVIVEHFLPDVEAYSKVVGFIYYATSMCAMSAIPPFLKKVAEVASDPLSLLKPSAKEDKQ